MEETKLTTSNQKINKKHILYRTNQKQPTNKGQDYKCLDIDSPAPLLPLNVLAIVHICRCQALVVLRKRTSTSLQAK